MSSNTSEPWPLDEPGEGETAARRTLGANDSEPQAALAAALDCIARLRAEIAERGQEIHDLRNDLHAARIQFLARAAEIAQLHDKIDQLSRTR